MYPGRTVDFSGSSGDGRRGGGGEDRKALMDRARLERETRQTLAVQVLKATILQRAVRRYLCLRRARGDLRRIYESRWSEYTTMLARRAAALKDNPMLESTLFAPESRTLARLIALWALVTSRGRERRSAVAAADDLKLLQLCAALIKATMDKSVGSERHNFFHESDDTRWTSHCEALVRMLLDRLQRDAANGAAVKDVKSFALVTSCLCAVLNPTRWNVPGCGTAAASPSSPSSPSAASSPTAPLSPAVLRVYKELLLRLIYKQQLFAQLRQLLTSLCFPASPPRLVSASAPAATAAPIAARPTSFIQAILGASFRIVEITSLPTLEDSGRAVPFLLPEPAYLFVTHILTLPSLPSLLTPALTAILTQPAPDASGDSTPPLLSALLSALNQLLSPPHRQSPTDLAFISLTDLEWSRIQSVLPLWAQYETLHGNPDERVSFASTDVQMNVPAPVHLLATLLSLSAAHFPLGRMSSLLLHRFLTCASGLLSLLPHSILALSDGGRFEFDSEDDESAAIRDLGEFVNSASDLSVRRELLVHLATLFSRQTIAAGMNHVFLEGHRLLEDERASSASTFADALNTYSLVDATATSNRIFLRAFTAFSQRHPAYFTSLLTLFKSMQDLRSARGASGAGGGSRILRHNAVSWLSFSTPFLPCLFQELQQRIGCELSEGGALLEASQESASAASFSASSIAAFFGFKSPKASGGAHSPMVISNRNRWEAAVLTARNGHDGARHSDVVVSDLFALWLSCFHQLLFVLEDDELLLKLPGLTPTTPHTLVSLVHLLKMVVFRLVWNKYDSCGRIDFTRYEDILQPAQRVLRELYQRDVRRNFMCAFAAPPSAATSSSESSKKKSAADSKKGTYAQLDTEMDTFADSAASSSSATSTSLLPPAESLEDALSLEAKAAQWMLGSGDAASRVEMDSFQREFEAWSSQGSAQPDDSSDHQQLFDPSSKQSQRLFHILSDLPFILPFSRRVTLLRSFIRGDSWKYGYRPAGQQQAPAYEITVRRAHVVADGLHQISRMGRAFKHKLRVRFITDDGTEEKGIDLGGPFKEFLELCVKEVFLLEYGFFTRTNPSGGGGSEYYPNPSVAAIQPDSYQSTLRNIGRVVGKALYEGILLEIPLASFFLNRFISQGCVLSDLATMDAELYKNLMVVKNYPGDVSDLGLSFTVDTDVLGQAGSVDLISGGVNIDVINANKTLYVYALAHYHLNSKLAPVISPFMAGLSEMIDLNWFKLFNTSEMRMLLSGSTTHGIDVADWRAHSSYEECSARSQVVLWFWEILESDRFTAAERSELLRFTTSCSRPPLQGFRELQPPFTVRVIPVMEASSSSSSSSSKKGFFSRLFSSAPNQAQLPSAATCFNTLKLPKYTSKRVLEEKLRIAIKNNVGFHLT